MPEQGLREWLAERPCWLQEVARRIFDRQDFTSDELAELCVREALGELGTPGFVLPGGLFGAGGGKPLTLKAIQHIQGINALSPKSPLTFGNGNLCIIYGLNGSGKSGYVRILKHACGARHPGILYPNVFTKEKADQRCQIIYQSEGTEVKFDWAAEAGVVEDLRGVDIYDTMCGHVYVSAENEVTYEPPVLLFLSDLIEISEEVNRKIENKITELKSTKPKLPHEYFNTNAGKFYNTLSREASDELVDKNCTWRDENEKELKALSLRLSEKSPEDKAKQLQKQKGHLDSLIAELESTMKVLSDENCEVFIGQKQTASQKRAAAVVAAEQVFREAPLEGVGDAIWKQLWEKARQYSEEVAYLGTEFPNVEETARCVLCQQILSGEAGARLQSFEAFVKGALETEATEAEAALRTAVEALPKYLTETSLREKLDAGGWLDEGVTEIVMGFFACLSKRQETLLEANDIGGLAPLPDYVGWLKEAQRRASGYEESAQRYAEDAKGDNRLQLQGLVLEFEAKKWISQQKQAIQDEVQRLRTHAILDEAKKLTSTTGLSRKKGDLADILITEAFVQRFNNELKTLGAKQIRVELVKTKVSKGRVLHKLQLCGAQGCGLEDVLSEGEFRIIALAAFLSDVAGKTSSTPFIFDDPISSLDQDYEEAVVKRLVQLAQNRQLIVFTHRLSLLVMIQDFAKKFDIEPHIVCVRQEAWGAGEPGDTPLFAKKPEKALNSLLNERLIQAAKILEQNGKEFYEPIAKGLCSEFRILLERMVENELLADVVQRFRRSVNTMGKIHLLSHINDDDCRFFDEMMTKYSRYEHSQPGETPVQIPLPDELKHDFEALRAWRDEFVKRGAQ